MKYQSYVGIELENTSAELEQLKRDGYFIKEKLLSDDLCLQISKELDLLWEQQVELYGEGLLKTIGDWGQIRGMMEHSKPLQDFIINKDIHFWVDQIVGDTSILHLQNGIVLHPSVGHNQAKYHKDFAKDFLSSKTLSLNTFIAIDDFTVENGGTYVVPGTHNFIEFDDDSGSPENQTLVSSVTNVALIVDGNNNGTGQFEVLKGGTDATATELFRIENDDLLPYT